MSRNTQNRKRRNEFAGNIESLETRQLMAADLVVDSTWTMDGYQDRLNITADRIGGTVEVSHQWKSACDDIGPIVSDFGFGFEQPTIFGFGFGPEPCEHTLPESYIRVRSWDDVGQVSEVESKPADVERWYPSSAVDMIMFNGSESADFFFTDTYLKSLVLGYGGNDTLSGGSANDRIFGSGGADKIYGNGGDDELDGGDGNDQLSGGAGVDRIFGGSGRDSLWGEAGEDELRGGAGNDSLFGGDDADRLFGESDDDNLHGGAGHDHLYSGSGKDFLRGGSGNDTLVSIDNDANDTLLGDSGFDAFWIDKMGIFPWDATDTIRDASAAESRQNVQQVVSFYNGADKTLDSDPIRDPTDGTDYKNFSHLPLFSSNGPTEFDIDQNGIGDCWLMSGLGAAAHDNPDSIRSTVVDLGDGTYGVELGGYHYRVDGDLSTNGPKTQGLRFAGLGAEDSIWVSIIQKAYTHHRGGNRYAGLNAGWSNSVFDALGAAGSVRKSFSNGTDALRHVDNELRKSKAVVINIKKAELGCKCLGEHAYIAVRVNRDSAGI